MTSRDSRLLDSLKNFLRDKSITESERISSIEKYIVIAEKNFSVNIGGRPKTSEKAIFWKEKSETYYKDMMYWKGHCGYWREKYQYTDSIRHDIYNKVSKAEKERDEWMNSFQEEKVRRKKISNSISVLKTWIIILGFSTFIMTATVVVIRNNNHTTEYISNSDR